MESRTTTATDIIESLQLMRDERQALQLMRFFKTGKGQYGEGDRFLGLKVPQTRSVVKETKLSVPLPEIQALLSSEWHEVRLAALLLLVEEMKAAIPKKNQSPLLNASRRQLIASFYLRNAHRANNWDLVDLSCPKIIGEWLLYPAPDGNLPSRWILDNLARSRSLWLQRIAIVSNWRLIKEYQFDDTIRIAEKLLNHPHDLIHKAIGWMLREVGKKDSDTLTRFLEAHYSQMPRTALRYAIEKMDESSRHYWLRR